MNRPLLIEDNFTYILQKCIIPKLHLLQGFMNRMFSKGLVPFFGRETALIWAENICKDDFRGISWGSF